MKGARWPFVVAALQYQQPHPDLLLYVPAALHALYCAVTGQEHEALPPPPGGAVLNDLVEFKRHEDAADERRGWRRDG